MSTKLTFHPQAWINDYAVDVDPEGETSWTIPEDVPASVREDSYEADALVDERAPQWVRGWQGPFLVQIDRMADA